ncbi:unnamed protein product [Chondrus crispus]|uniref:plastoquinol--plastocyanin reductase n=1 Tax=Chondrus crispus TaxID=2769 RepID=S0F3J4_CHOCR|nr:unnamed protein product [Chondrus crispus]CDF77454.1 unnamed protein product [Chondrus crispus]|eukprot:XP_005712328.1 unnamed protein product [Chondrus crispus]
MVQKIHRVAHVWPFSASHIPLLISSSSDATNPLIPPPKPPLPSRPARLLHHFPFAPALLPLETPPTLPPSAHPNLHPNLHTMAFVDCAPVLARGQFAGSAVSPLAPTARLTQAARPSRNAVRMAAAGADEMVPDMAKRNTMNLLLFGSTSAVALGILGPFAFFFVPQSSGGGDGGVIAKDALGTNIQKKAYLDSHNGGSRELVQGLRGDATYLIVTEDKSDIEYYALNAVCTHLGCVVPWNKAENKFMCPCHGSQYAPTGAVVRGPAPLPLALERVEEDEAGNVVLKSWKEEDFRTGGEPWWKF